MSSSRSASPRIAIIGAGIAGLACARVLAEAGVDVHVFEKSRGVSGRMSTRGSEDWQCDHGAQYFTARDPLFRAEVLRWIAAGAAALWTPRMQVFDRADATAGREHVASVERFVGTPGMTAPGRLLAQGLLVHTQCHVDSMRRTDGVWQLQDAQGRVHDGVHAVLLAIPAPQAAVLLQDVEPALAARVASVSMRPSWALMLQYETALPLAFDAAFVNAGPLRWVARDSSKPGRPAQETWLLHGTAAWSASCLDAEREAVAEQMLDAFALLSGGDPRQGLRAQTLHRWLYADSERTLGEPCLWNAQFGVGLCGDWLDDDKVEGAWRSGRALAATVLAAFPVADMAADPAAATAGHTSRAPCVQRIAFGSPQYTDTLRLREAVLRVPLGLQLSAQDLQGEDTQWHFGLLDPEATLLACVVAVPGASGVCKLRQMAVRADCQGQGLGSHLLAAVEALLRAQGATSLVLHARKVAVPFYTKLGYALQGSEFMEVGLPHWRMEKSLLR
jgi:renalase